MKRIKYLLYTFYPMNGSYQLFSPMELTKTQADYVIKSNRCTRILTKYPVGKQP